LSEVTDLIYFPWSFSASCKCTR